MGHGETMSPTNLPQLSRRSVCVAGALSAGAALLPFTLAAHEGKRAVIVDGGPLYLRGVRLGEHAVLRTQGKVWSETSQTSARRVWHFEENTAVSWVESAPGQVIELRTGRIQLSPSQGGRIIEITTGPVEEILSAADPMAVIATSRTGQSLIVAAGTLTPSDAWQIAEHPTTAALPVGLSEVRVFRTTGDDATRQVVWTLRSPWLSAWGYATPDARLIWRGQGQLTAWRHSKAIDLS